LKSNKKAKKSYKTCIALASDVPYKCLPKNMKKEKVRMINWSGSSIARLMAFQRMQKMKK